MLIEAAIVAKLVEDIGGVPLGERADVDIDVIAIRPFCEPQVTVVGRHLHLPLGSIRGLPAADSALRRLDGHVKSVDAD